MERQELVRKLIYLQGLDEFLCSVDEDYNEEISSAEAEAQRERVIDLMVAVFGTEENLIREVKAELASLEAELAGIDFKPIIDTPSEG